MILKCRQLYKRYELGQCWILSASSLNFNLLGGSHDASCRVTDGKLLFAVKRFQSVPLPQLLE
jgi:hypothetical protein